MDLGLNWGPSRTWLPTSRRSAAAFLKVGPQVDPRPGVRRHLRRHLRRRLGEHLFLAGSLVAKPAAFASSCRQLSHHRRPARILSRRRDVFTSGKVHRLEIAAEQHTNDDGSIDHTGCYSTGEGYTTCQERYLASTLVKAAAHFGTGEKLGTPTIAARRFSRRGLRGLAPKNG